MLHGVYTKKPPHFIASAHKHARLQQCYLHSTPRVLHFSALVIYGFFLIFLFVFYSYTYVFHALHHTLSDGLVCNEPSLPVTCVSLHMSVITQYGESPLMVAVRLSGTEVVSLLVKAGAALDLQNKVNMRH